MSRYTLFVYSRAQVFITVHMAGLGLIYAADGRMLSNPAYLHQEVYARHAFFAAVMIIFAVASATVPRYKCRPPRYRILMTAGFAIYFLLAISFFPGGPTATWTYFVFAAVAGYEALR